MSYTCCDVDLRDQIAHIQFKRPEAFNSMLPEFWSELPEIVNAFDAAGEARAIVISSTGKHFTAGMDLSVINKLTAGTPPETEFEERLGSDLSDLGIFRKRDQIDDQSAQ